MTPRYNLFQSFTFCLYRSSTQTRLEKGDVGRGSIGDFLVGILGHRLRRVLRLAKFVLSISRNLFPMTHFPYGCSSVIRSISMLDERKLAREQESRKRKRQTCFAWVPAVPVADLTDSVADSRFSIPFEASLPAFLEIWWQSHGRGWALGDGTRKQNE